MGEAGEKEDFPKSAQAWIKETLLGPTVQSPGMQGDFLQA